jgi:hypothetical protein
MFWVDLPSLLGCASIASKTNPTMREEIQQGRKVNPKHYSHYSFWIGLRGY